jgi:iron complex outermembrane receptor protein
VQVVNPNYGAWIASTPSNTEAFGLSYQQKYFDVAIFDKRVGPTWNDNKGNTKVAGTPATINQAIPINPFSVTDLYVNFTVRAGSHFDQSKLRFGVNNLFNVENIIGITAANTGTLATPYPTVSNGVLIDGGDQLALMPGRSFTVTFTLGYSPKR